VWAAGSSGVSYDLSFAPEYAVPAIVPTKSEEKRKRTEYLPLDTVPSDVTAAPPPRVRVAVAGVAVTVPLTGCVACQKVPVTGNTPSLEGAIESEAALVLIPRLEGNSAIKDVKR
jgi:hypothetical protein